MELKSYQTKVLEDLERYLGYVQKHQDYSSAFNRYWEDQIGPYNPIAGTGMEPYKDNIPKAPHVCIKVPTAGGKTFIAINALHKIFAHFAPGKPKTVLWLVPWSNLLQQTFNALNNSDHPYRQKLNALFGSRVAVYQKEDVLQGSNFNPTIVKEQLSIIVMSFASLRAKNKEDRKVYQQNGQLADFAHQFKGGEHTLDGVDETALINVLRGLNPVLVVDESHNAESDLSLDMLKNLQPSFILDLTATPRNNSNIVSLVPAIELKKENMVKLPVIVYNSHDKTEVIDNALHLQRKLEHLAKKQEAVGGKYIRPIVLFQAQPKMNDDNTTYAKLKEQLLRLGIPEHHIKIKTADIDELKGVDLMSKECEVRYIITINALKEGWDCPFAYILASLADKSSAVDVEQILGRVLRQPHVQKHKYFQLNLSYVLTASSKFNETLSNIIKGLQEAGFSNKDYRKIDTLAEEPATAKHTAESTIALFTEEVAVSGKAGGDVAASAETNNIPHSDNVEDEEIDHKRVTFNPNNLPEGEQEQETTPIIAEIDEIAKEQHRILEAQIEEQKKLPEGENMYQEMGDKVKRYKVREANEQYIGEISLPQFFIKVMASDIFGTGEEVMLNRELLLKDFKLSDEDVKIDFTQLSSDIYQVDLEEKRGDDYRPTYSVVNDSLIKDPLAEYIFARPKNEQVTNIAHQLMQAVGKISPISEREIKVYLCRVLDRMNTEQLKDVFIRKSQYTERIKDKIRHLADLSAEKKFNELVKTKKVISKGNWKLSKEIIPGNIGSSIGKSLYESEGIMNGFEERVALELGTSSNIVFWHRNLERGKGFYINGFKANHYPDFIMRTVSGKIILVETKGDHLDNADSTAKCRLGKAWENLAGNNFAYFMIFEKKQVEGAYTLDDAKKLIASM